MKLRAVAIVLALAAFPAMAQEAPYAPPRTADGKPNLGGVWTNAGQPDMERPNGLTSLVISREVYERMGYDEDETLARTVNGELRSSQIVDPPDGKLPFRNRAAALAWRQRYATYMTGAPQPDFTAGPDTLPNRDRCIMAANAAAPPMTSQGYNDAYQIVQTPAYVVISIEMMNETRIVPVFASADEAARSHRPQAVRRWTGDSVGWWDGDTFVVETLNVDARQREQSPMPMSADARIVERFTRIHADELLYQTEVTDLALYTRPWRTESSFRPTRRVWEYACHEGNYDVTSILATARRAEHRANPVGRRDRK